MHFVLSFTTKPWVGRLANTKGGNLQTHERRVASARARAGHMRSSFICCEVWTRDATRTRQACARAGERPGGPSCSDKWSAAQERPKPEQEEIA